MFHFGIFQTFKKCNIWNVQKHLEMFQLDVHFMLKCSCLFQNVWTTLKINHPMLQNDKIECFLNVQITIKIFLKHVNNVLNIKTFKLQTVASDQNVSL